ncbi:uncharacterized protein LOC127512130 [Ctenopharyngodon idella]|uniref:uncharacterized protein LOC127512130 n=1 Tax=Ctenopharyngodon idella TaxID=7959 RepID=UPI002230D6B5|nr:uncharacterized protein LOC127512130 [Ctenopharyngodon idella]
MPCQWLRPTQLIGQAAPWSIPHLIVVRLPMRIKNSFVFSLRQWRNSSWSGLLPSNQNTAGWTSGFFNPAKDQPPPLSHGRSWSFQSGPRSPELFVTPFLNGKVFAHQESRPREPSRAPDGPVRKRNLQLSVAHELASKCACLNPLTVSLVPLPVAGVESVVKCSVVVCCAIKNVQLHKKSCFPLPIATHTHCSDGFLPPANELSHHFTMTPLALYAEKWRALLSASRWVLNIIEKGYTAICSQTTPFQWRGNGKALIQNDYIKTNPRSTRDYYTIILSFLQERLDCGRAPSTLKVYVAARVTARL